MRLSLLVSSSLRSLLPSSRVSAMSPHAAKLAVQRQKMKKMPSERAWSALQAAYASEAAVEEEAAAALTQPPPQRQPRAKTVNRKDAAAPVKVGGGGALAVAAADSAGVQKRSRQQAGLAEQQPSAVRARSTSALKKDEEEEDEMEEEEEEEAAPAPAPKPTSAGASALVSNVRFSSLNISPLTKKVMSEVFGYEFCTHVQAQTIGPLLTGADVVAKAKTGSGKTLAFMIPAIQALIDKPQNRGQVGVLVLSPTRELAMQILTETEKLLQFNNMTVQAAIGGTNLSSAIRKLESRVPDVLVATPGRCLDLLENSSLGSMVKTLRILILDEADNILDMGFRPTLERIIARLPEKNSRQTMLFSATFPADVKSLAAYAFKPSYKVVDTVGQEDNTNVQVQQFKCVVPHAAVMTQLSIILKEHIKQEPAYKVIVFFPTARMTQLYAETFQHMRVGSVLEIHSRKSQGARTRISDTFRASNQISMFTSDVSARGVDYPEVTLVIQVGLPSDKAQYVHRVGRTARAGRAGQSILLLADYEKNFLRELAGLPVRDMPASNSPEEATLVQSGLAKVPSQTKAQAYQAWLGFYKTAPSLRPMKPVDIVAMANEFSRIIGCREPPELEAKTVGKMGLKGVPGLRIVGKGTSGAFAGPKGEHAAPAAHGPARPYHSGPPRGGGYRA